MTADNPIVEEEEEFDAEEGDEFEEEESTEQTVAE